MGTCCCTEPRSIHPAASIPIQGPKSIGSGERTPRHLKRNRAVPFSSTRAIDFKEAPTAHISQVQKTATDRKLIMHSLRRHAMFQALGHEQIGKFIEAMELFTFNANEVVFAEQQPSMHYFVLASGTLETSVRGRVMTVLTSNEGFGEVSFLTDAPRIATVTTKSEVALWGLHRGLFTEILNNLRESQHQETRTFLDTVKIFSNLSPPDKDNLTQIMELRAFTYNTLIMAQGVICDFCFFIKSGIAVCLVDGKEVRRLRPGDFFGEENLLHNKESCAALKTVSEVSCWTISRKDIDIVLGESLQNVIYKNYIRIAFEKSQVLSSLSKDQKGRVLDRMEIASFTNGQVVIQNEAKIRTLWVVVHGFLVARNDIERKADPFSCVGEECLIGDTFKYSGCEMVVGSESAVVATISVVDLETVLGGSFQFAIDRNPALEVLLRVPLFQSLHIRKLSTLMKSLSVHHFCSGEILLKQGDIGSSLLVIKSGEVEVTRNNALVRTLSTLDYIGERAILSNESRTASVVAKGEVVCWMLDKQGFDRSVDSRMLNMLKMRIELQDDKVELDDLVVVKVIKKERARVFFLMIFPGKQRFYDLKVISKDNIKKKEEQAEVLLERELLLRLFHPFIIPFVKPFRDSNYLYFLSVHIQGADLYEVLRARDSVLKYSEAKFLLACLLLVLEYLHGQNIVYRDLKPESIWIDEKGYPSLMDFDTAKVLEEKTFTIVGTPHYLAPEVVQMKGYGFPADYWALGIIFYECVCGQVPFGEEEENPYKIYETIIQRNLTYPSTIDSNEIAQAKPIIETLLDPNPVLRIPGSISSFKKRTWFNDVSWVRFT